MPVHHPTTARPRALLWALMMILLTACDSGPGDHLDDYLERLARTLDTAPPPVTPPPLPRPPAVATLQRELPGSQLGTLDFLSLSGCEVQITIGKRNSSLGRLASASQRLLLDLEYLRLAPACIDHLMDEGKTELATVLREAHRRKREQLPVRIFEATLGGPEYRALWRGPRRLGDYPAQTSSAVITALESVSEQSRRWLGGDYQADNLAFELKLSEIAKGDGGHLLRALARQHATLAAADRVLVKRRRAGPLCTPVIRPAAADILPRVVRKVFTGAIQPWSAALDRRRFALLPPVRELEQQLSGALPEAYRLWRASREEVLGDWNHAPRRHVQQLQTLLEPCGGIAGTTTAGL